MKLLVVGLFALWSGIFKVGEWLLSFLGTNDVLQVIFTMGLFPIMMNILQFWLIDSIVKASAHSSSVALSDSPRNSADPDTEPLFRGSLEDDDDEHAHPRDIESQLPRSRSTSRDSRTADEPKSSSATTATATGSGTVTPKIIDTSGATTVVHAYPPSMASTSSSPASSRQNSVSPPKRRRSPPPPLALRPIPHATQASLPHLAASPADTHVDEVADEKEWAAWDEHGEDWANRVGEEDWTGRRLHATKNALSNVWADDGHHNTTLREST
ncbi:hypothetical protein EIP86_003940 [Pleurotus ostreatoroseus]|nr:hypothetical protein EIP86_003940 [Pleurotus ostreatoroseus]